MKVNPKTVMFALDIVAAVATALSSVVLKHYLDTTQSN